MPFYRKNQTFNAARKIPEASLIRIQEGKYSLFFALEIMRIYISESMYRMDFSRFKTNYCRQHELVDVLMKLAEIPTNLNTYDAEHWCNVVQDFYNQTYGAIFKIFIFNSFNSKPIYKSKAQTYKHAIALYYHDNHFDGIKTISSIFNSSYYCFSCESTYSNKKRHSASCNIRCINCGGCGPEYPCPEINGFKQKCDGCNKIFLNETCYNHHIDNNICNQSKRCEKCTVIYRLDTGHTCGEKHCNKCRTYHAPGYCFIQTKKPKTLEQYRLITFDFEATQVKQISTGKLEHEINFACVKVLCTKCITSGKWNKPLERECEICGLHRTLTWAPFNFNETKVDRHIQTDNVVSSLFDWMMTQLNPKFETLVYSHYGGRYDITFLFGEFVRKGATPDIIRQGNRLYQMIIPKSDKNPTLVFRDSFNFVSEKLDKLVKAFSLDITPKLHFPHLYNRPENYNIILPHVPELHYYSPNNKKEDDKIALEEWHRKEMENWTPFNLCEKLAEYCENDVNILTHALIALQKTFFKITRREGVHKGIDILAQNMTIAGACMHHYKLNHLKPKHLAIVPEEGYDRGQNQSSIALKFIAYYEHLLNREVQSVLSDSGEKKIGKYSLDGYVESLNWGFEVHGCYYHGCPKCYPNDNIILAGGQTAGELRAKDREREAFLKPHLIDLQIYWECDIRKREKEDKNMADFFKDFIDCGPINERDCFFGGRTEPWKTYETIENTPGFKISYKDFTSLYPFTNYSTSYPVKHPKVKKFKYSEQKINWRHSSQNKYKGMLKVLITPPKTLSVPVLPIRFDHRLLFPLCRKCSLIYPEGAILNEYNCNHSDEERSFVSTCTHIELNEALDAGYVAKRLFRVMEFEEWDDTIFKDYVREFYKIKLEASGFPDGVETEEQIVHFIRDTRIRFGIDIDRNNVKKNMAMRTLAKICLNSLWGKFSMRNNLTQTVVVNTPSEYRKLLDNTSIEITSDVEATDATRIVTFEVKSEFIEEHSSSNVIISLWTTSAARIYLLKALQKVAATPGCKILYMDTDSVVYLHPDDVDPLPTGPHIGDLTDEVTDKKIIEFVAGGCKNYAFKYLINGDSEYKYKLKIRGISLDYNASQEIKYDTFKQKVLNYGKDNDPIIVKYDNFLQPNLLHGTVYTKRLTKRWRPYIPKGIVVKHDIKPFGSG